MIFNHSNDIIDGVHGRIYVNGYDLGIYSLQKYSYHTTTKKVLKGYSQSCYQVPNSVLFVYIYVLSSI